MAVRKDLETCPIAEASASLVTMTIGRAWANPKHRTVEFESKGSKVELARYVQDNSHPRKTTVLGDL
jgi:hypothetical protein